jgi:predicted nucleotidyltransferase component of viral defense system
MIKPNEISKTANTLGLRETQIEKDYVIGWVLKGLSNNEYLKQRLAFKGGTALRKIYFPDYRLSEDMDFTFTGNDFNQKETDVHFIDIAKFIQTESRISINIEDRIIHQTGNYSFNLYYTGPLGGKGANKSIKVDIATDELLCNLPVELSVNNKYSDLVDNFCIFSYTLEEIIAEKMRSLIQRTTPRDVYDLWYLLEEENCKIEDYIKTFNEKSKFKNLNPFEFSTRVEQKKEILRKQWESSLLNQVKTIPDFEKVWRLLNKQWRTLDKINK